MSEMIRIVTLSDEYEARFLEKILKEKEIPYILRSFYDSAYDGVFQAQYGWGIIESYEEYQEDILKIHEEVINSMIVDEEKQESDLKNTDDQDNNKSSNELSKTLGIILFFIITLIFIATIFAIIKRI